ncbi:MAG: sorbitol dehydrogenase [Clostridiales bacterium]|nr:MAG: sorbitol dehydrogenase [Clostridiales bacterium]
MKAIVKLKDGEGNVELINKPEPSVKKNEVKIKVEAVGICGTDVKIKHGTTWSNPPVVLGHELSGVVSEVGEDVKSVKVGDRVVTETGNVVCGHCYYCRTGNFLMCKDRLSIGYGVDGGMAQYCVVREDIIHILPDEIDFDAGSLCEPAAVSVHAVYDAVSLIPTDTVVVIGAGAIGLLVAQLAKNFGATVIVTGLSQDEERLVIAKDLGVDYVVNTQKDSVEELVNNLTDGRGADVVYECSGSAPGVHTGMSLLKKMGALVQIGLTKPTMEIEYSMLTAKQIKLVGTFGHKWQSWDTALKLMNQGKINADALISHRFAIDDWEEAFGVAERGEGLKVVIFPNK